MTDSLKHGFKSPPEQQANRDKCFHPSGTYVQFPIEDVETSIPGRFASGQCFEGKQPNKV